MDEVLPRIKFEIDPNNPLNGVKVISLVDEPAIESDFIFFNKSKTNLIALKGENYKQVVAGLALIPDKDILRIDALGLPYNGYFTKESIEVIRNKFHQELLTNRVNTDHNSSNYVNAYLIESFIIDSEERLADVKKKGIEEAVIGSWFVSYKIEDEQTFKRVVSGELKGFSVEIFLQKFHTVDTNNLKNEFKNVMNEFLKKFKELLKEAEASTDAKTIADEAKDAKVFEQAKTADGKVIEYGAVGEAASIVKGDGKLEPAADGEYPLDNGKIVTVASGVVAEIKDAPAVEQQTEAKVEQPQPVKNQELEEAKAELEKVKSELKVANDELVKMKSEVEKLKKAPLTNPIVTETKKVEVKDITKLSNAEKLMMKYNIN